VAFEFWSGCADNGRVITRRALLGGTAGAVAGAATGLLLPGEAAAAAPRRYVIGRTRQDRRIVAYRLGSPDAPSRYVVIGCMHGDESAGNRIALHRMIKRRAPDGVQVWIVPTMNPDGVAAGSRTNSRGVDLNRNFPSADWHRQDKGTRYYSGPRAASERETRAMVRFLSDLGPRTVVSIHQPLHCVDYSGGDKTVTNWLSERLHLPARRLGASGGNMTTWFNDEFPKRTAVTLELGGTVTTAFGGRLTDVLFRHAALRA
jgi:predicted deacylase